MSALDKDDTIDFILRVYVPDRGAHGFVGRMLLLVQAEAFCYGLGLGAGTVSLLGLLWRWL